MTSLVLEPMENGLNPMGINPDAVENTFVALKHFHTVFSMLHGIQFRWSEVNLNRVSARLREIVHQSIHHVLVLQLHTELRAGPVLAHAEASEFFESDDLRYLAPHVGRVQSAYLL